MITLQKIDFSTYDKVLALTLSETQKEYMQGSILKHIADAQIFNSDGIPAATLAIIFKGEVIGWLMYVYETADWDGFKKYPFFQHKSYFLYDFMIDNKYQGKGLGKLAFQAFLNLIATKPDGPSEFALLYYNKRMW